MNGWFGENSWWCMYSVFYYVLIVVVYELVNVYLELGLYCINMNIWKIIFYYKKVIEKWNKFFKNLII